MSGWIKIHRSIQDHWLYKEKRSYSKYEAWTDILLTVNFTEAKTIIKGKVYEIRRGESILSLETWSVRWGWDKSKVRRFLNLLQKDNMIIVESDNITTRLKVCKYDDYQDQRHASETQTKHKRHSNDIQTTPIKEEEESKEEKEVKTPAKIDVDAFLNWFNEMKLKYKGVKGKFKVVNEKDKNNLHKLKNLKYDSTEWEHAFKMMCKSQWVQDNDMITPTHFLVNANFQKYMNKVDTTDKIDFAWNR